VVISFELTTWIENLIWSWLSQQYLWFFSFLSFGKSCLALLYDRNPKTPKGLFLKIHNDYFHIPLHATLFVWMSICIFACFHESINFMHMLLKFVSLQVGGKHNILVGAPCFKNIYSKCHLPSLTIWDTWFYYYTSKATIPMQTQTQIACKIK
jgi:hypothetical protein